MNHNISEKLSTFELNNYDAILKLNNYLNEEMKTDSSPSDIFKVVNYTCADIDRLKLFKDTDGVINASYTVYITCAGQKICDISDFDIRKVYAFSFFL